MNKVLSPIFLQSVALISWAWMSFYSFTAPFILYREESIGWKLVVGSVPLYAVSAKFGEICWKGVTSDKVGNLYPTFLPEVSSSSTYKFILWSHCSVSTVFFRMLHFNYETSRLYLSPIRSIPETWLWMEIRSFWLQWWNFIDQEYIYISRAGMIA